VGIAPVAPKNDVINLENDVFYHRLFFSLEKEEQYSFTVPFDSNELLFVLQTEKKTLKVKISVKQ